MARRGSFGRLPRAAPDLSGTIISIAREMLAMEDSNILSAWQNGGTYQGQQVTDAMILAHYQERMTGLSSGDPEFDKYKLAYDQLDYSIHESRQFTLYKQGKLSAQGMAKFYLDWEKKIPDKNSEFYRTLQKQAAQFLQSAVAGGRAAATKAKEKAYTDAQNQTDKARQAGAVVTQILTDLAVNNGLLDAGDPKGLTNVSDPAQFEALVKDLNARADAPLYMVNGKPESLNDVLTKADPKFVPGTTRATPMGGQAVTTGGLTSAYIISSLQGSHAASLVMAGRATAMGAGHKTEAKAFLKDAGKTTEVVRDIGIFGVAPAYDLIIAARDHVLFGPDGKTSNPNTSAKEKQAALDVAAAGLSGLAATPGLDTRTVITLVHESNANAGQETGGHVSTFGQDPMGRRTPGAQEPTAVTSGESSDPKGNQNIAAFSAVVRNEVVAAADPANISTFGVRDPVTHVFTADPTGTEIGTVPATAITSTTTAPTLTMAVLQSDGSYLTVTVVGKPIQTVAHDTNGNVLRAVDGNDMTINNPTVWIAFDAGGNNVLYRSPDGGTLTNVLPLVAGAKVLLDPKTGIRTIDLSAIAVDGQPGFHTIPPPATSTASPELVYTPPAAVTDRSSTVAGHNADIHFNTGIEGSLANEGATGPAATAVLRDNPNVAAVLRQQNWTNAGGTFDVQGNPVGDQTVVAAYTQNQMQGDAVRAGAFNPDPHAPENKTIPLYSDNSARFTAGGVTGGQPGAVVPNPSYDPNMRGRGAQMQARTIQLPQTISVPGVPTGPGVSGGGMPTVGASSLPPDPNSDYLPSTYIRDGQLPAPNPLAIPSPSSAAHATLPQPTPMVPYSSPSSAGHATPTPQQPRYGPLQGGV